MHRHHAFAATSMLLLTMAFEGEAAAREPFTAERMWSLARVGPPSVAPDGRTAVVAVTRFGVEDDKPTSELWLVPTAGGEARQLTARGAADAAPVFSPDGRSVAFVGKRGDDEDKQIYVIPIDGGEARRVTSVPGGASAPRWFPDGRRLAFMASVYPGWKGWDDQGKRHKEAKQSKVTARVFDRAPTRRWDHTLDGRELHLFAVSPAGGEPTSVTATSGVPLPLAVVGEPDRDDYDISPDGKEIAFAGQSDRSGVESNVDIYVVPAEGGSARNLTPDHPANDARPRWSPDGRWIAYVRQERPRWFGDRRRLAVIERATGKARVLTERWDRSFAFGASWTADGKSLLAAVDHLGRQVVFRVDAATGEAAQVTTDRSFSDLAVPARSGPVVALRQAFDEPPTLVAIDAARGAVRKLSTFNDAALAASDLGRYESITYPGAGGQPIQAWVVYPPGFDRQKKYPFVLLLHGGPQVAMNDGFQWRWNAQVFASWGYVVAWHSFHGTPGFGQAFTDSIEPDWVTLPYEDTVAAARWFAAQPWVDPARMAAAGASYGGYLGATVLGREHPFKTLVVHAGVYDRVAEYAGDFGAEHKHVPEFWEDEALYKKLSPIWRAPAFKTPTLVTAGALDARVPDAQAFQLFHVLQNRGVKSRFVYYPNESHWILKRQNSLHWYGIVRDWLAEQLGAAPVAAGGG
jgi:dipeptidyl aminopeptidase/acylaminoacyl peptidase